MADEADVRGTEYLVLERLTVTQDEPPRWKECETTFARSAQDAIAKYVRSDGNRGGKFAAVPTRSFKTVTVATETQTRLTFT